MIRMLEKCECKNDNKGKAKSSSLKFHKTDCKFKEESREASSDIMHSKTLSEIEPLRHWLDFERLFRVSTSALHIQIENLHFFRSVSHVGGQYSIHIPNDV